MPTHLEVRETFGYALSLSFSHMHTLTYALHAFSLI